MKRLRSLFSIDLRALAVVRVGLALLILSDLLLRAPWIGAFLGDEGLVPRAIFLHDPNWRDYPFSLHLVSGYPFVQGLLAVLAGLAALALLAGYRTRLAVLACWLLFLSLANRNPFVLSGADALMRVALFWCLFLPLGARWSVDSALDSRDRPDPDSCFSAATAGLLVQLLALYFFTALLKTNPVWMPEGTAVYYALSSDYITTGLADYALAFPGVLRLLTYFVWCLELLAPLLVLLPFWQPALRLVGYVALVLMHLGFLAFLKIGLFPLVNITLLTILLPGSVWDRLDSRLRRRRDPRLVIYFDGDCGFCGKVCLLLRTFLLLPGTPIQPTSVCVEADRLREEHFSWVIADRSGFHHSWPAMIVLVGHSPLFAPLSSLLALRPLRALGDRLYQWVGAHRERLAMSTAALLPMRSNSHWLPGPLQVLLIAILATFVLYWNVTVLPWSGLSFPQALVPVQKLLHLKQSWEMFAPEPGKRDQWFVVRGRRSDGSGVDAWGLRETEPDFSRPAREGRFPLWRWRLLIGRLARAENNRYHPALVDWLCRRWEQQRRPGSPRLENLELYLGWQRIPLPGEAKLPPRKKRLLSGDCPAN
ncbi:MAG: HTTM domain-containing protein [Gammaproteobacteria bacterium]|nr:HTTM domain-containing protein [Gammaproteobacteria bacterium]